MTTETIGITVTYKEPITFHLRMIGIDEESQLRQKMFGLTDAEKADKQYQTNVDMLADLSVKTPKGAFPHFDKNEAPQVESEISPNLDLSHPATAIREFFREKTVTKERIAEYAVRAYFVRLQPEVSFF